ncbi:MAG: hypothetical protein AAB636_00380 [Patescibacteria group bacterium]
MVNFINMKGDILLKVLEILKEQTMNQVDFMDTVLSSGYGVSMGRIDFEYKKIQRKRHTKQYQNNLLKERKKRLRVFISKMKHDGLIEEKFEDGTKFLISSKGIIKLSQLKNRLPYRHYKKQAQSNFVVVSFDIPERLRRKRNWLREVIRNLSFIMVHQSVWVGKTKIPETLILDLENLHILEYVEIFEISKNGTLKKLTK